MRSQTAIADELRDLDAAIEKAVAPHRDKSAIRVLRTYGKLGDQSELRSLSAGTFLLGLVRRDARLVRAAARMLAAHELATGIKSFLKHRIDRKRPRNARGPRDNAAEPGDSRAKAKSSFPSGHSAGAVAVARAFAREYPARRRTAATAAGLVAAAQIPRSTHFATDVLVGATIGWAAEALVDQGLRLGLRLADIASGARGGAPGDAPR